MTDIRERRRRAHNDASLSLLSDEYCFLRHVLRMQSAMLDRIVEIDKLARHCDTLRSWLDVDKWRRVTVASKLM
jgi:hypothetical protein